MSKQSKSVLPSLEIIIILVFFFTFIVWAVSKCGATKQQFSDIPVNDTSTDGDEVDIDSIYFTPEPLTPKEEPVVETTATTTTTAKAGNQTVITETVSRLYVTIDGLNMRTGPHLDSSIIQKFPLFEEVYFTGEYSDSTQRISLGKEMAEEHWVRVKSKKGKIGWVYGAGVDFKKKKRTGVQ